MLGFLTGLVVGVCGAYLAVIVLGPWAARGYAPHVTRPPELEP